MTKVVVVTMGSVVTVEKATEAGLTRLTITNVWAVKSGPDHQQRVTSSSDKVLLCLRSVSSVSNVDMKSKSMTFCAQCIIINRPCPWDPCLVTGLLAPYSSLLLLGLQTMVCPLSIL